MMLFPGQHHEGRLYGKGEVLSRMSGGYIYYNPLLRATFHYLLMHNPTFDELCHLYLPIVQYRFRFLTPVYEYSTARGHLLRAPF